MDQLDISRFTSTQAAGAAGMSPGSLRTLLARGEIALAPGEVAEVRNPGTGRSRLFSARHVLHIALTAALTRCGLTAAVASELAVQWLYVGGPDSGAAGGRDDGFVRLPGGLYPDDQTIMRVTIVGDDMNAAVERLSDAARSPFIYGAGVPCDAVLMVDLSRLHARTLAYLGVRP